MAPLHWENQQDPLAWRSQRWQQPRKYSGDSGPLVLKYSLRISYTLKKKRHWGRGKTDKERQKKSQKDTESLSPPEVRIFLNSLGVLKGAESKTFDFDIRHDMSEHIKEQQS